MSISHMAVLKESFLLKQVINTAVIKHSQSDVELASRKVHLRTTDSNRNQLACTRTLQSAVCSDSTCLLRPPATFCAKHCSLPLVYSLKYSSNKNKLMAVANFNGLGLSSNTGLLSEKSKTLVIYRLYHTSYLNANKVEY